MTTTHDIIILGGGVAGMTSAIYAARANLRVLILDENACGGLVNWTKVVENMPSYTSIGGMELAERINTQVEALGVDIEEAACIDSIDLTGAIKVVEADDIKYTAKAVIVATGRKPVPLEVVGECDNVHFCAICDGAAYKDKKVLVVGGGNSGFDEAVALLDQGIKELLLIEKMDRFFAAQTAQELLASKDSAAIEHSTEVVDVLYSDKLHSVTLRNVATGETRKHECDGIFVFMGQEPGTEIFANQLVLDSDGYIETDELMQTSLTGVYAAGDVRQKKYRQITTAMSDGTIAALEAERFLHSMAE